MEQLHSMPLEEGTRVTLVWRIRMKQKENRKETAKGKNKKPEGAVRTVQKKTAWRWELLPLQIVLIFVPLIMDLYFAYSGYSKYPWYNPESAEDIYGDVFLHGKMVAFSVVAVITFALAVYKVIKMRSEERKKSLVRFIPLFVYAGCVILSTISSDNMTYSLYGSMEIQEPVLVLLGYVTVAFYAYIVLETLQDVMQLTTAAVIGSVLMAVIGVLQTLGKDPFLVEWVQKLIAGSDYIEQFGPMTLSFPKGQAYGTLFNPNYVGTYVAIYTPLLLIGFVMYKQWWKKLTCGLTFLGLLVMLFASQSRTGLIAIGAVAVMILVFLGREIWKRWYVVIPGVTFLVMAFLLMDTYRDNLLTNRLKSMLAIEKTEMDVSGVDTTGKGVRVVYKDTEFTVQMKVAYNDFAYVVFEGEEQKEVTYAENKTQGYFTLSNGDEIEIQTAVFGEDYAYAFGLWINNRYFYFTNQVVAGDYKYINAYNHLDECTMPENVFPGYESVASGRGYVWGRTIPLLWKHMFLGSGPDTYTIVFPQTDYVARFQSGFNDTIFTRPHNFYLQMGIQTGVLSLIAFLVFYVIYFVGCCRRYFVKKFTGLEQWFGFALFLCTIGFMASGFANDSLIVVSPVFYVLFGVGIGMNEKLCPVPEKESEVDEQTDAVKEKNEEVEETAVAQ